MQSLKPDLYLIQLGGCSILKQLQIEEALLRTDIRNWCLINTGAAPSIVMGISGDEKVLINKTLFDEKPVPIIRRFSGGGTVFINEETMFVTFICNSEELNIPSFPEHIFQWSEKVYKPVFQEGQFKLQENDYVMDDKKFGGNAQYLCKNRWLHHTSLLFNFDLSQMEYLNFPKKVPHYREKRSHEDFLCKLNTYFPSKEALQSKIETSLQNQFQLKMTNVNELENLLAKPHRKSTKLVSDLCI